MDETNSAIGMARLDAEGEMDAMLARIQNDLFDLGADLSVPEDGRKAEGACGSAGVQVERLEREIDAMNEELSPLNSFVCRAARRWRRICIWRAPSPGAPNAPIVELAAKETDQSGRCCTISTGCRIICS